MSETTNTTSTKTSPNKLVERALRDVTSVGRSWAAYGLTVSKSALETSASTLRKTAEWLAGLSERVSPPKNGSGDAANPAETPRAQ